MTSPLSHLEVLRRALEPFAKVVDEYEKWQARGSTTTPDMLSFAYGNARFGFEDVRRAREALDTVRGEVIDPSSETVRQSSKCSAPELYSSLESELLEALKQCRSSIAGFTANKGAADRLFNEIQRIDSVARKAIAQALKPTTPTREGDPR